MEKIPYLLELNLRFIPRRLNEVLRQHHMKRHSEISEIYRLIHLSTVGKRPNSPLEKCSITIIRHSSRSLDWDNCVSSYKPIIDGLVKIKIIMDDTWETTGPWTVLQSFRSKKEGPLSYIKIEGLQDIVKRPRR